MPVTIVRPGAIRERPGGRPADPDSVRDRNGRKIEVGAVVEMRLLQGRKAGKAQVVALEPHKLHGFVVRVYDLSRNFERVLPSKLVAVVKGKR